MTSKWRHIIIDALIWRFTAFRWFFAVFSLLFLSFHFAPFLLSSFVSFPFRSVDRSFASLPFRPLDRSFASLPFRRWTVRSLHSLSGRWTVRSLHCLSGRWTVRVILYYNAVPLHLVHVYSLFSFHFPVDEQWTFSFPLIALIQPDCCHQLPSDCHPIFSLVATHLASHSVR